MVGLHSRAPGPMSLKAFLEAALEAATTRFAALDVTPGRRQTGASKRRERLGPDMPKYLVIASYTSEGIKGVIKTGGTARSAAVQEAVQGLGGTLESFHFAFGEDDAFVILDIPDNISAAAIAMTVSATGLVAARVVVLLTPSEVDEAAKRQVAYTPPGK
jgi:uncharacterized protein with GYD domain